MEALAPVVDVVLLERYHHLDIVLGSLETSELHHLRVANQVGVLQSLRLSTHHAVVTHGALSSISDYLLLDMAFVSLGSILHVLLLKLARAVNAGMISYKLNVRYKFHKR